MKATRVFGCAAMLNFWARDQRGAQNIESGRVALRVRCVALLGNPLPPHPQKRIQTQREARQEGDDTPGPAQSNSAYREQ